MRIIVAGSRTFADYDRLAKALDKLTDGWDRKEMTLISGHAKGADKLGEQWAEERRIMREIHHPDYQKHGEKLAPIIRNTEMVKSGADLAVVCWDGESKGTFDLMTKAKKAGIRVVLVRF